MQELVKTLSETLRAQNKVVALAESCTGGMISSALTDLSGASSLFDRGFVTYSNQAKRDMLGVSSDILQDYGAVSAECAVAMAKGALENSHAGIAISVTGIAGPDGGNTKKPVGTVFIGLATQDFEDSTHHLFTGSRSAIRQQTCETAFETLINFLEGNHD